MLQRNIRSVGRPQALVIYFSLILLTACTAPIKTGSIKADPAVSTDAFSVVLEKLLSLEAAESAFEVEVWTDKASYTIGEEVTFFFRTNRDAFLSLLDIGTSGELRVLFPNPFQKTNFVRAGQIVTIPSASPSKGEAFSITVEGPTGLERIKAIATTFPLPIADSVPQDAFLRVSRENTRSVSLLQTTIQQLWGGVWAGSYAEINIVEAAQPSPAPGQPRTIKPKKPEKPIDITGTAGLKPKKPKKPEKPIDIIGLAGMDEDEKSLEEIELLPGEGID